VDRLPTPTTGYSAVTVSMNGETAILEYRWIERTSRWKLNILDVNGNYLVKGIVLVENFSMTSHLSVINKKFDGFLGTVKLSSGDALLGRNNLGVNKTHELIFMTYDEYVDNLE
jgi:hypothetical protein